MNKGISIIIQARMGSSRLPGKILKEILGKPVLWHVINRVSKSKYIDDVIVATTNNLEDNVVETYCIDNNIKYFRGSEDDVLDRYYKCAKKYSCKNIVRITSDCPLHDALVIDKVIEKYLSEEYDYVSNTFEYTYPDGLDVEVFSFNILEEAWEISIYSSEREHVTPFIKNNDKYKKINVISDKKYPVYRLTLDSIEDYELINKVYNYFGKDDFSLDETVDFLYNHPEILKLNENHKINEGYIKSLREDRIVK